MHPRPQQILEQLEVHGRRTYQTLADQFGVTTMTIRRDVAELVARGALIKTLGGVQRAGAPACLYESDLRSRLTEHAPQKQAIAEQALALLAPRRTLFLDGSTTCLELARLLADRTRGLTIITHSALLCTELGRNRAITVIGIGGEYDASSLCFVGATAEAAAGQYFVEVAFLSTKGFVPAEGTYESAVANFRIKQVMARQAKQVVLLVDHSKFGQSALRKVLDISQIHVVVTDRAAPRPALAGLRRRGIKVCVAGARPVEATAHAT